MLRRFMTWYGARKLERIKKIIGSVPEGRDLLDLIEKESISVTFDFNLLNSKRLSTGGYYLHGTKEGQKSKISLNPFFLLSPKHLTNLLIHEMRHAWQYRQLSHPKNLSRLSFDKTLSFIRFIEADAFAFTNYLAAKISKETGHRLPYHDSPDWLDRKIAKTGKIPQAYKLMVLPFYDEVLRREHAEVTPDEAATGAGLKKLFNNFQASMMAEQYDHGTYTFFSRAAASPGKEALPPLKEIFNTASFRDVGEIHKIAAISTSAGNIQYQEAGDPDRMLDSVWQHVKNKKLHAMRSKTRAPAH